MNRAAVLFLAFLPAFAVLGQTPAAETIPTVNGDVRVERLATLEFPWGMAYLPDGRLLITEKPGRLRIYANGQLSPPVDGVPRASYRATGSDQGGMLDVAVDPDYARNGWIYLSFVEELEGPGELADTGDIRFGRADMSDRRIRGGAVARAKLAGNALRDLEVIWRQVPKTVARGHFGHRIVFGNDGKLFITSGDRMRFEPAQHPGTNIGKIVRINPDGSLPSDNPFAGKEGSRGDVWSTGHRNMLAAAVHPTTGNLWIWEMGPLGGDELNVITAGKNYGWPIVSNGDNYDNSVIPDHPSKKEFEAPIRTWTPVLSPSGALFYSGSLFPWRDNILVGGLSSKAIIRLTVNGTTITNEERIDMKRRIRDVIQAPDGAVLAIVDDKNGELLRLTPARR